MSYHWDRSRGGAWPRGVFRGFGAVTTNFEFLDTNVVQNWDFLLTKHRAPPAPDSNVTDVQLKCEAGGGTWKNGGCFLTLPGSSEQPPGGGEPAPGSIEEARIMCLETGGQWSGTQCVGGATPPPGSGEPAPGSIEEARIMCLETGGQWSGTQCVGGATPPPGGAPPPGQCSPVGGQPVTPMVITQFGTACINSGGQLVGRDCKFPDGRKLTLLENGCPYLYGDTGSSEAAPGQSEAGGGTIAAAGIGIAALLFFLR